MIREDFDICWNPIFNNISNNIGSNNTSNIIGINNNKATVKILEWEW